jgi:hypothetical protein
MSIFFKLPTTNADYSLRNIDSLNAFPKDCHELVNQLINMLPPSDTLKYYSIALSDDWFEDGIEIVRNDEIFMLAKLDEYHDCGVF